MLRFPYVPDGKGVPGKTLPGRGRILGVFVLPLKGGISQVSIKNSLYNQSFVGNNSRLSHR